MEIELAGGETYAVNLIDPRLMQTYDLGYTQGGLQAFDPPMGQCLLRFERVKDDNSKLKPAPIQTLVSRFLKDPSIAEPHKLFLSSHSRRFTQANMQSENF